MFQIIIHQSEAAIEKPPFELSLPSIWLDFIIYSTERHFQRFHPLFDPFLLTIISSYKISKTKIFEIVFEVIFQAEKSKKMCSSSN